MRSLPRYLPEAFLETTAFFLLRQGLYEGEQYDVYCWAKDVIAADGPDQSLKLT